MTISCLINFCLYLSVVIVYICLMTDSAIYSQVAYSMTVHISIGFLLCVDFLEL